MKKYYPVDFDEKGNAVLGNAKSNPTSNGFIPTTWAPGGSDEEKQGLKSITISPAITTNPSFDSLFPIYWDDLPEGEIEEGAEIRTYGTTLHTGYALTDGTEYTISATPTSGWHIEGDVIGGDGETVAYTSKVFHGTIIVDVTCVNSALGRVIVAEITIKE